MFAPLGTGFRRPLEIHSCVYRKTPLAQLRSEVFERRSRTTRPRLSDLLNEEQEGAEAGGSGSGGQGGEEKVLDGDAGPDGEEKVDNGKEEEVGFFIMRDVCG